MIRYSLKIILATLLFSCFAISAAAQGQLELKSQSHVLFGTGGNLPFWLHSNKYGIYDKEGSNLLQSFSFQKGLAHNKLIDYGFGVDVVGRLSANENILFNELYGEAKVGFIELYAGKKKWSDGIWSSGLSLGSMIWSGNTATMPKIMIRIPEYVPVPYTNRYLSFRGYLGHGWFGDNRYVEGTYLHEKALYLRLLQEEFPVNGHIGIIHNVQWAGKHPTLGDLPDSFGDYLRIFSGRAGEANTSPGGEVINALGNTVGAYEACLDVDLRNIDISAYRQFFIETSVSTRLRSPWDGQWGLKLQMGELTSNFITTLLWEHLNTKEQNAKTGETIGADQYYHNFIYRNGWSYKSRILGSPLVQLGPVNDRLEVVNNIILAHHLGLEGSFSTSISRWPLKYQLKTTYSRSYGRTSNCGGDFCDENDPQPLRTERKDQWYHQLKLTQKINKNLSLNTMLGIDKGKLSDETGFMLGVTYSILNQE